jgi:NDP-sugar pyrophosphorylase family protein
VNHSIERAFFPALLARGDHVAAYVHRGYWIDIGTPEKYLQVHRDILRGGSRWSSKAAPRAGGWTNGDSAVSPEAKLEGPFYIGPGCRIADGARIGPDAVLIGGVTVGEGASVRDSVLWKGAQVGAGARVEGALLGQSAKIGRNATAAPGSVLGEDTVLSDYSRTS